MALIIGGVVVVAAALALALTSLGGSSGKGVTTSSTGTVANVGKTHAKPHTKASSKSSANTTAQAGNPAETIVTVLNGTEKAGLAHRVSGQLQQSGYSQANALSGRPPGANQTTVVEYASGQKPAAEGVARSLSVNQVQPMEPAVAALAGSASVVVIVGADTAAKLP